MHDPALALFADGQGLDAYRALVPAAWACLRPGGVMALVVPFGTAAAYATVSRGRPVR